MEDFFWDHFNKSVPMSTYLAAFVVADFERIEADVAGSNWAFNIYARPSAQNQTQYTFNRIMIRLLVELQVINIITIDMQEKWVRRFRHFSKITSKFLIHCRSKT